MKTVKKILGALLVLSVLIVLNVSALAYDVTVYGGNSGTMNGEPSETQSGTVSFGTDSVTVTNDKYFAKGFALAGHGSYNYNGEQQYTPALQMTPEKDLDYVVVYGVKAAQVSYTVAYLDTAGNTIRQTDTYYANDGDYVYLAAPYINGYTVSTANGVALNGAYYAGITVHEGSSIQFVYAATTTAVINNTASTPAPSGTTVLNGDGTAADTAEDTAEDTAGDTAGDNAEIGEQQTPTGAPDEDNTVDLDGTDDTPTTNFFDFFDAGRDASHIPLGVRFILAGIGVIAIGTGIFFLVKTLRKKKS